jgi:hypothetical protein
VYAGTVFVVVVVSVLQLPEFRVNLSSSSSPTLCPPRTYRNRKWHTCAESLSTPPNVTPTPHPSFHYCSLSADEPKRSNAVVALMSICSCVDELFERAERDDLTEAAIRDMCADHSQRKPQGPWARKLLEADTLASCLQVCLCVFVPVESRFL